MIVTAPTLPATIGRLAQAKRLPAEWLRRHCEREDIPGGGIRIPYFDDAGELLLVRERENPSHRDHEGRVKKFHQPYGVKLVPCGLNRLEHAYRSGILIIVEGESDCWTWWYHGLPALGLPGAFSFNCLKYEHVAGIHTLYLWREPDQAGPDFVEGLVKRLQDMEFENQVFELRAPDFIKDASALHVAGPARFKAELRKVIEQSVRRKLAPPDHPAQCRCPWCGGKVRIHS
jgi:putative DNA primase/helicase